MSDDFLSWFFIVVCALLIGFCMAGLFVSASSPHYMLKKSDWECSSYSPMVVMQPINKGANVTMVPVTHMRCSVYRLRGD